MREGWKEYVLSDVIERFIDYRGKTPTKIDSGIPLVTAKIVKNGRINEPNEFISSEDYEDWMTRGFPEKNDILLTTEAPLGELAIIFDTNIALAQRIITLRCDEQFSHYRFIKYLFESDYGQHLLHSRATGTTVLGIKAAELKNIKINLPPLPTQRKIARILSAYDDLIENNLKRIKLLEEMAQITYEEWFVRMKFPGHETAVFDEATGLPEGWKKVKFNDIVNINPRTLIKKNIITPFVPMSSISENSMVIQPIEERVAGGGAKFKNGDTLFARITPCLENGKTGFVQFLNNNESVAFGSTEFIVFRETEFCDRYFIYCTARNEQFRENAIISMVGSDGRQRVNPKAFEKYIVNFSPIKYRQVFKQKMKPIFKQVHNLTTQNQRLKEARDILLPRLMTGMIDVEKLSELADREMEDELMMAAENKVNYKKL